MGRKVILEKLIVEKVFWIFIKKKQVPSINYRGLTFTKRTSIITVG